MIKNHIVYSSAVDWRFSFSKAEGSLLWDKAGKKYIDFSSGWNTTNLGWNNKEVIQAVIDQANRNVYAPMWTDDPSQNTYADKLISAFSGSFDAVCRATGGTEANEMALKISRAVTGRSKIISFAHTYHGQSFGTLALGYIPEYVKQIAPLVPEFIQMDYPNAYNGNSEPEILEIFLNKLETYLRSEQIAAVFTEPGLITGWGSMMVAPRGFLTNIRKLTKKYNTLLVVDEVGSGFSRTGKLFALEHENVIPDIVTLAKGISNGAGAIGAVVTKKELVENYIDSFKPTSTFGWNPLACAAAQKTLEIHQRDRIWEQAEEKGAMVKSELKNHLGGNVNMKNLRGWGLEIAFDIDIKNLSGENNSALSTTIVNKCFEKGLHIADAGDCIQLMPPITIENDVLNEGLQILIKVIKEL